jgi:uncharacterized protein YjeT (DUF2065 family)
MEHRIDTLLGIGAARAGGAGLSLVLAPRLFRRLLTDFLKLSDEQLRVIGYVLVGIGATLFAQRAVRRSLSAQIEALSLDGKGRSLPSLSVPAPA